MEVNQIDIQTAKEWLDKDEAILIDVREPAEYEAQSITRSTLCPLGTICCDDIPVTNKKILIHCKKGGRSNIACQKLLAENNSLDVYNIIGGIEAWEKAGLPVKSK